MQTVQHTKHFAHPANWAGFLLIGGNIRISNKIALIGQALCELIKSPDKCRDALRVCLHLVNFEFFVKFRIFYKNPFLQFYRLRKVYKEYIAVKRMQCTQHKKVLTIKLDQYVVGKIF